MTTDATCSICGRQEPDRALLSECFECGSMFHLNPYSNREGIDCGDAILGETLGVYFYCQRCIEEIDREQRAAEGRSPHERAAAMMQSLHGGSLPVPPSNAPAGDPPGRRRTPARRRYRRIG